MRLAMGEGAHILTLMAPRRQSTFRLSEKAYAELAELKRLLDVESSRALEMAITHFLSTLEHGESVYFTRPKGPGHDHKSA